MYSRAQQNDWKQIDEEKYGHEKKINDSFLWLFEGKKVQSEKKDVTGGIIVYLANVT